MYIQPILHVLCVIDFHHLLNISGTAYYVCLTFFTLSVHYYASHVTHKQMLCITHCLWDWDALHINNVLHLLQVLSSLDVLYTHTTECPKCFACPTPLYAPEVLHFPHYCMSQMSCTPHTTVCPRCPAHPIPLNVPDACTPHTTACPRCHVCLAYTKVT